MTAIRHIRVAGEQPSTPIDMMPHLIAAEPLIAEMRREARDWRDQQMQALRHGHDLNADVYEGKAVVIKKWADRIEHAIGGGR